MHLSKLDDDVKLDVIGQSASWRHPWDTTPCLYLPPPCSVTQSGMNIAMGIPGLQMLERLPLEVHHKIRSYCKDSLIWRYGAVLECAEQTSPECLNPEVDYQANVNLREVVSWKRGQKPVLTTPTSDGPQQYFRIMIDYRGPKEIELLQAPPPSSIGMSSESLAYIVGSLQLLGDINVALKVSRNPSPTCYTQCSVLNQSQTQFGQAHFHIPPTVKELDIWNRPFPPVIEAESKVSNKQIKTKTNFGPPKALELRHFKTIDLEKCTGLTFFVESGATHAVHAHTEENPTAEYTYQTMSPLSKAAGRVQWIYVPIAEGDVVEAFGSRMTRLDDGSTLKDRRLPCEYPRDNQDVTL